MSTHAKVQELVQKLIVEGQGVIGSRLAGELYDQFVDLEKFEAWKGRCRLLLTLLGSLAGPWEQVLGSKDPAYYDCDADGDQRYRLVSDQVPGLGLRKRQCPVSH